MSGNTKSRTIVNYDDDGWMDVSIGKCFLSNPLIEFMCARLQCCSCQNSEEVLIGVILAHLSCDIEQTKSNRLILN